MVVHEVCVIRRMPQPEDMADLMRDDCDPDRVVGVIPEWAVNDYVTVMNPTVVGDPKDTSVISLYESNREFMNSVVGSTSGS